MTDINQQTDITAHLDKMDEMLALPQVLVEILHMVDNEQTTASKLATVVMHDPNMTAKLLRMANSSFYSRGKEITTVKQAILILGVSMVKCLALSTSIFQSEALIDEDKSFDIRDLYSHCLGTAIAAKFIAEEAGFSRPEEAFTAGLLHDLGHLFLLKVYPDHHMKLLLKHQFDQDLPVREREAYGIDHAELGGLIAAKWHLPQCFRSAIENHHCNVSVDSVMQLDKLDLVVLFADFLAGRIYSDSEQNIESSLEALSVLTDALGLKPSTAGEVSFKLLNDIMMAAEFLGVDIGDPLKVLQKANRRLFEAYATVEDLFRERRELSRRIIQEEHRIGAMRCKDIAIATLSHYINNAATIISGRTQLLQLMLKSDQLEDPDRKLDSALQIIDEALLKIMAVLAELKSLSSLDDLKFYNDSDAINIDESIQRRMDKMAVQGMEIFDETQPDREIASPTEPSR
ncbi:MAG: HDOD domain-containing protein [candidate division Zixibacteria bacterium]|nr:HDOD domain-containing protein [candidate division Zixibacteria bacterium]MBU1470623.1 HDOD domain-containing protein [candidate division Zixibacteria bacterium]MBU2624324.1 HDOD domain-containing protein [candidate division Zixibacteria bacterium]